MDVNFSLVPRIPTASKMLSSFCRRSSRTRGRYDWGFSVPYVTVFDLNRFNGLKCRYFYFEDNHTVFPRKSILHFRIGFLLQVQYFLCLWERSQMLPRAPCSFVHGRIGWHQACRYFLRPSGSLTPTDSTFALRKCLSEPAKVAALAWDMPKCRIICPALPYISCRGFS